jgi:hypothetical protein
MGPRVVGSLGARLALVACGAGQTDDPPGRTRP